MSYCSFSGRTVHDGDENCVNCARRIFLDMMHTPMTTSVHRSLCPKCRGSGLMTGADGQTKVDCDYPGCKNGRVEG